jgi:hypothetical protein
MRLASTGQPIVETEKRPELSPQLSDIGTSRETAVIEQVREPSKKGVLLQ